MTMWQSGRSVSGCTGTLFALAAAARRLDVVRIERARVAGPGLAYGTRASCHLLNVPVSRMDLGLQPGFAQWLPASGIDLSEALEKAFGAHLAGRHRRLHPPPLRTAGDAGVTRPARWCAPSGGASDR